MKLFKKCFLKAYPIWILILIVNALLFLLKAISESKASKLIVAILFAILNFIGAWSVFSNWQKSKNIG